MSAIPMPCIDPVARFHWRAAVPGVFVLTVLATELCVIVMVLAHVVRP